MVKSIGRDADIRRDKGYRIMTLQTGRKHVLTVVEVMLSGCLVHTGLCPSCLAPTETSDSRGSEEDNMLTRILLLDTGAHYFPSSLVARCG